MAGKQFILVTLGSRTQNYTQLSTPSLQQRTDTAQCNLQQGNAAQRTVYSNVAQYKDTQQMSQPKDTQQM